MRSLLVRSLVLAAALATPLTAQDATGTRKWADSLRTLIDVASVRGDMSGLDGAIALSDRVLTIAPTDPIIQHYKGFALYRKANLFMGQNKKDETKAALEEANEILEASAKQLPWPETFALRSSIYGQLIGVDPGPITAMRYGPRADDLMEQAMKAGPPNARVYLMRGIGLLYKPRLFGGGADKAERDILKAIELLASDHPPAPQPVWGRLDAWAFLGQAYAEQGNKEKAREAYQKALEIEPESGWVRHVLLPALERR
jgi:tetratricopeptide (TPR) repeat protein